MQSQVSLEKGGGRRVGTESDTITSAEDATMWALKMQEGARWPLGAEKRQGNGFFPGFSEGVRSCQPLGFSPVNQI